MQIVIKISKEDYERLKEYEKAPFYSLTSRVYEAIANGTPLPKDYGRLIDADKLDTRERGNNSQRTMWWNIDQIVRKAPTIIEADKEDGGK